MNGDAACSSGADETLKTLQQRLASIDLLAQQSAQTVSEAQVHASETLACAALTSSLCQQQFDSQTLCRLVQVKEIDRKCKAQKKRKVAAPKQ